MGSPILKRGRQTIFIGRRAFLYLRFFRAKDEIVLGCPPFQGLAIEGADILMPDQRDTALADPSFDFALGKLQGMCDFFNIQLHGRHVMLMKQTQTIVFIGPGINP
jgi:hypothetical protein